VAKAKMAIGSIRRTFGKILTQHQRHTLLFGKVAPIFTYGLVATYPLQVGDQKLIERLNRYVCRVVCNNFAADYEELLRRMSGLPLYQTVTHRRILLAHNYHQGRRYQPPGTIRDYHHNPRLRLRSHTDAMTVSPPTARNCTNSALENIASAWNRLPGRLAAKRFDGLKRALKQEKYSDGSEHDRRMQDAVQGF
jgi:hypothetical protein